MVRLSNNVGTLLDNQLTLSDKVAGLLDIELTLLDKVVRLSNNRLKRQHLLIHMCEG
ncbi:hypothetical protein [Alkalibacillus flavidus]|uniref:hypothetical protein n=1 Tax=Alkalibacillus flavidus TaxID=546021 RepID=UPI00366A95CC